VLTDLVVSKVARDKDGSWRLTGSSWGPSDMKMCHGQFETQRITAIHERVSDREIEIETTTWCRSITQARAAGVEVTVLLKPNAVPLEVHPGDAILLLVEPKKQLKFSRKGEMEEIALRNPTILRVSLPEGPRYQRNAVLDWQFAKASPPVATSAH
jgi:hypothetical protein